MNQQCCLNVSETLPQKAGNWPSTNFCDASTKQSTNASTHRQQGKRLVVEGAGEYLGPRIDQGANLELLIRGPAGKVPQGTLGPARRTSSKTRGPTGLFAMHRRILAHFHACARGPGAALAC